MKVSILIPNYNHVKTLRRCIESAQNQTYQDLDIVIVDDGSTDESVLIIDEYAAKDKRINFGRKTINTGFPQTFQQCYKMSTGEIIFGLATDDFISNSTFIELAVQRFQDHPTIGLVWAKTELIYEDGEHFTVLGQSERLFIEKGGEFLSGFLRHENFVAGYSAVFKRSCLEAVGGFHFDLGPQSDYFPNHAVPSKFGGCFIPLVMTTATVFRDKSNYSNNTSEQDRIWRHCEFEKRMRALKVEGVDPSLWFPWRKQLIKDITVNSAEYAHYYFAKEIPT